jgi:acetyltransferase-like isoleucine patch superfamily enzyme
MNILSSVERSLLGFKVFGRGSVVKPFPRFIKGGRYITIGEECFFGEGLVMSATDEFQGVPYQPVLKVGNRCTFGSDAFFSCTTRIEVEDDVLASARVFIGDSYHDYRNVHLPVSRQPMGGAAPVKIGAGSFLGIGCVILPGTTLGKGCYVGANAVVHGTFDDHCVLAGVPARVIRRYDALEEQWI